MQRPETREGRPVASNQAASKLVATNDTDSLPARSRVGIRRAANNSPAWWWSPAMSAIEYLADTGHRFTADHLRDLGVMDPDLDQRWGALFSAAARANVIESAGACISRSGRPVRVWIGVKPE